MLNYLSNQIQNRIDVIEYLHDLTPEERIDLIHEVEEVEREIKIEKKERLWTKKFKIESLSDIQEIGVQNPKLQIELIISNGVRFTGDIINPRWFVNEDKEVTQEAAMNELKTKSDK